MRLWWYLKLYVDAIKFGVSDMCDQSSVRQTTLRQHPTEVFGHRPLAKGFERGLCYFGAAVVVLDHINAGLGEVLIRRRDA